MEKKIKKFLSVSERLKLVDEIKLGKPVKDVARDFGVSKAQAYKVFKSKDDQIKLVVIYYMRSYLANQHISHIGLGLTQP